MEQSGLKPWEKFGLALLVLVMAIAAVGSAVSPERFRPMLAEEVVAEPASVTVTRDIGLAPTVRKGPKAVYRGELVSTWIVSGAGDSSYNGTYAESGSYGGQPCYTNGSRWLFYFAIGTQWALDTEKRDPAPDYPYGSRTSTLPSTWAAGDGYAPAPTVTEYVAPPDPVTNWPYTYSAAWSAPSPTGGPCIAPCRATIGGTTYIVLAEQGGMFHLYDPSADTWAEADYGAALFASGQYDPTQGAGLFDAGDGTHVWACSGSWGSWRYYGAGGTTWRKFALTPGGSASLVSQATPLIVGNTSNYVVVASGIARFVNLGGPDLSRIQLWHYEIGAPDATIVKEFYYDERYGTGDIQTDVVALLRTDHRLFLHDDNLYWMRHVRGNTVPGPHYIIPYLLTDDTLTRLTPFTIASTDYYQTWGYYSDVSRYVGDIGSGGTPSAQVDPAGAFWTPAAGGATRAPFPLGRVTRRWYLDGTPLLVVGWAADDADDLKPFVMNIEPYSLQATAASSFAAGRHVAGARTTSYAVDEGVVSHVSAAAVTSFAAGRQATAAAASSHAAGLAVTGEAETSFAADLARPSTTPHPVQVNVSMVRGRVIG